MSQTVMLPWSKRSSILVMVALLGLACSDARTRTTRLQSFRVTLKTSGGTAVAPMPFSATPVDFVVDIEALDTRGVRIGAYDGIIKIDVEPGELTGLLPVNPVRLQSGVAENVRVSVRRAYGDTRIIVASQGCDGSSEACRTVANSQAVGASNALYFQNPRIRDIQSYTGTRDTSPLANTLVTVDRGRLAIAHVSNSGFSVIDRDDTEYNTLFAYNFSRPNGIRRGDILRSFSGQVGEFLGYTELGFPLWDIELRCPRPDDPELVCDAGQFCVNGECLGQECGDRVCAEGSVCKDNHCTPNQNVPDAVSIDDKLGNNQQLEKFEGGLVSVSSVMNSQEYIDCDNPAQNPGANGDGVCQYCRTCNSNRDINGACPVGGRCCLVDQVCNTPLGECTATCDADRAPDGKCETGKNCCIDGTCNQQLGGLLFPGKNLGICRGCTVAEKVEAICKAQCDTRAPPQKLCTNLCDFRDFDQYRAGITDEDGNWTGKTILLNTSGTLPYFRSDTPDNLGRRFAFVKGIMSNLYVPTAVWILTPRDECDVGGLSDAERKRTDCATVK